MSQNVEQRIRDRAYAIWQEQGCPEGCDYEHWLKAEQEVAATATAPKAAKKATGKGAAAPAATERKPRARKAPVTA
ncbi:DUF2934 domain-containing protein [Azospirillum sp. sgz301742]